jgi:ubiquinone/menaquinone biosynthesis C-methylase UbiE
MALPRVLETEVMDTPVEAAEYDAMDHRGPNTAFVDRLMELGAWGNMLDIGTGPAHIPLLLADRLPTATILALDLADHMLTVAQRNVAASRHADRIELRRGDAKALPLPDAVFDTVFSNTILHHLADPRPYLLEAARVLRPGGALLIRDLYRPDSVERLDELVVLHAGDATERQQAMFRDSLHAALTPDELRELVRELGLVGFEVVVDTDRHMSLQRPARHAA